MNDSLPIDNAVVPDPVAQDDTPSDVNTFSISPEAPLIQIPEVAPIKEAVEKLTPEVGQEQLSSPEISAPVPSALNEEPKVQQPAAPVVQQAPSEHVVDKRDHDTGDHKLQTTDKITSEADEEEADFIDHVEQVHSIK